MKSGITAVILFTCVSLLIGIYPQALNASLNDLIYPPSASPYGLPHKDWGKAHWDWWLSIPREIAPYPNPGSFGYSCFIGLGYPVIMLADPIIDAEAPGVSYTCTIPSDRGILIAGIQELCNFDETYRTDEDLQKCVHERNDWAKERILIDGKEVPNVEQYRSTTGYFNVTYPEDNMYTLPPTTSRALLDGTWMMLKPLPVGNHTIEVHVSQIIPGRESENLFLDLTYNLRVV